MKYVLLTLRITWLIITAPIAIVAAMYHVWRFNAEIRKAAQSNQPKRLN